MSRRLRVLSFLLLLFVQVLLAVALSWTGARILETAHSARARALGMGLLGCGAFWSAGIALLLALRPSRTWIRECSSKLWLAFSSATFTFVLGSEVALRHFAAEDRDGNLVLWSRLIYPLRLPVASVEELVLRFELAGERSKLIYDSELGWAPRPGYRAGVRAFDDEGIRVSAVAPSTAISRALELPCIALFGDSYTEGYGLPLEDSWGEFLARELAAAGTPVRVRNLGVQGYGMDQALLRWRKSGAALEARVVAFGLQLENCERNVNILRPLYTLREACYISEPFSKPRFVVEGDALRVVNQPCMPPQAVPQILRAMETWELLPYEEHYDAADGASTLLDLSMLWRFGRSVRTSWGRYTHEPTEAQLELARAIIDEFARDVRRSGASFVVVYLPTRLGLERLALGRESRAEPWLAKLAEEHRCVNPQLAMLEAAREGGLRSLFLEDGHYAARGHRVVGTALAEELRRGGL
ncbi:MAG: hypothetical protein JNM84_08370 [Planctomycetes bacterium]|nr:hypothetical protein [Planctomycetota bacterium]